MIEWSMYIIYCILSFSTGLIVSFGFLSLVSSVGLIRNILNRFNTKKYKNYYLFFLVTGVIFASIVYHYENYTLDLDIIGKVFSVICGLFYGMFVGYLAIGLSEVFDMIPVVNNKLGFRSNVARLVLICAIAKSLGSLCYFILPGFYNYN